MNLLLLDPSELRGDEARIAGRRAQHLVQVLRVRSGDKVRVGVIDGLLGWAEVRAVEAEMVSLHVHLERPPKEIPELSLILALPRPIMLQRILKQATVLGVRHIHLIRSQRVEKSFFHSPVLQPEKIRALLLEGLEQAMDTRLPQLSIHPLFRPFMEEVLPNLKGHGLIAHPGVSASLAQVFGALSVDLPLVLAIGPEGGWNEHERAAFERQGFQAFSLGERILHVDTAVVALLAQINLLYDLRPKR